MVENLQNRIQIASQRNSVVYRESNDATTLSGGAGDDLIEISGGAGEVNVVNGGDGNDTINETASPNIFIRGGAGDDVLSVSNQAWSGTGYTNFVDAGEGNDTIILEESASHDIDVGPGELGSARALVYGGSGSDTWDVTVDEGISESENPGYFYVPLQANGAYRMDAIEIADFEPGIDTLEIDATPQNDGFTLTTARIEQLERVAPDKIQDSHVVRSVIPCLAGRYGGQRWANRIL